jgi:hypothetical protein
MVGFKKSTSTFMPAVCMRNGDAVILCHCTAVLHVVWCMLSMQHTGGGFLGGGGNHNDEDILSTCILVLERTLPMQARSNVTHQGPLKSLAASMTQRPARAVCAHARLLPPTAQMLLPSSSPRRLVAAWSLHQDAIITI